MNRKFLGRQQFSIRKSASASSWLVVVLAAGAALLAGSKTRAASPSPPLRVIEAEPLEPLSKLFRQTSGWTGADGAYSIPISPKTTLWIFDDTWIGGVEKGRRVGARMINNTFAWQALPAAGEPLKFFWQQSGDKPAAVLQPEEKDSWYWPGDAAVVNDRLYMLAKRVAQAWASRDFSLIGTPTICWRLPTTRRSRPLGIGGGLHAKG